MKIRVMAAALLGVGGMLASLLAPAAVARPLQCETVERFELANGLDVVLQEDHSLPLVAIVSAVDVGYRHDPKGYSGLAHYVEHLLLRGVSPETGVIRRYQEMGATRVNAFTSPDATRYVAMVPAERLEQAIWLEARHFGIGLNEVTVEQAEDEAEVVRREFALREKAEWRAVFGAVDRTQFLPEHPYQDHLSSVESLQGLTLDNARWFHEQLYSMKRTRLAIVGDIDPKQAKKLVEKYWSNLRSEAPKPSAAVAARPDLVDTLASPEQACLFAKAGRVASPPHQLKVKVSYKTPTFSLFWPVPEGQDAGEMLRVLRFWTAELGMLSRDLGLAGSFRSSGASRMLASSVALRFNVIVGQKWEDLQKLVAEQYSAFAQKSVSKKNWQSTSQHLELQRALAKQNFLSRAMGLTEKFCSTVQCDVPEQLTRKRVLAVMKMLQPSNAMIVTTQYDPKIRFGTPVVEVVK